MAETNIQATLGLQITAEDKAQQVFSEFATKLAEQMTKIQESMKNAFNMDTIMSDVDRACTSMAESFDRVTQAETKLRDTNIASGLDEQITAMTEAIGRMEESFNSATGQMSTDSDEMRTSIERAFSEFNPSQFTTSMEEMTSSVDRMATATVEGFDRVAAGMNKMNESTANAAKGINFMEIQNAGMMMQSAGEKLLGFFTEAAKAGVEFDQAIVNTTASLQANMGTAKLTTDQIDAMKRSALDYGNAGFFSANQVAEAMNTMSKQGINYQTIMNGGIDTVYKVAAANQQNLEQTANVVSDIYNEMSGEFTKMGMTTQQSAQVIGNSMTVALHHARLSMDDFMATMKYVGPQASAVGMSIQDVSTAIAVLGEHGIKASQAGTTLRRMLTNLTPSSKAAGEEMNKLGLIVNGQNVFYDQATGKMKSMADIQTILHDHLAGLSDEQQQFAIKTIFGQYALSGMTAIVNTAPSAFAKLTTEMKNNGEMQQIMDTKSQGLGFQVQKLQAHFSTLQKEIGMALAPVLVVLIQAANKLMDAFTNMNPHIQQALVILGAATGVLLTVGGAVFTLIGTFGMFLTSWKVAIGAFAEIGAALGPVLIALGLLVAAVALVHKAWQTDVGGIWQYTQQFTDWFQDIWKKTIGKAESDIKSGLKSITKGFTGWQRSVMEPVNHAASAIWSGMSDGMKKLVSTVADGITAVTGWFKKMAPTFNQALHNIVTILVALAPVWNALWVVLKFVVGMVFDWIVGIIQHFWGVISGVVQLVADIFAGKWKAAFTDLWQIVKNALLLVIDLWGGAAGKFFGGIAKILERTGFFGKAFTKLLAGPFKLAEKMCNDMWKYVEKYFDAGVKAVRTLLKAFGDAVKVIWEAISGFFSKNASKMWSALKSAWSAGVNGLKTVLRMFGTEVQKVWTGIKMLFTKEPANWWKSVTNAFKTGYQVVKFDLMNMWDFISGIFKEIKDYMKIVMESAWELITAGWNKCVSWVSGLLDSWGSWIKSTFESIKTNIQKAIETALNFIKTKFSTELNFVQTIINAFKTIVNVIFGAIKELISGHIDKAMIYLELALRLGINVAKTIIHDLMAFFDGIFGGLPSKFMGWASNAMSEFSGGISRGIGWVRGNVDQIINVIGATLAALPGQALQWGQNMINMFVSGIKAGIGAVGSAVQGVANTIKGFLGMHSPAPMGPLGPGESDQWFPNMMKMFEKGINDNKDKITKATMGVAVGVQSTIMGTQDHIHQFVNGSKALTGPAITNNSSNQRQMVVNINVEGRSVQTDKQLAENIFKQFRTQMPMVTG